MRRHRLAIAWLSEEAPMVMQLHRLSHDQLRQFISDVDRFSVKVSLHFVAAFLL